jgi:hypothetical protein
LADGRHIHIKRVHSSDAGTFGVVLDGIDGEPFCISLELPWADNIPNISCIRAGIYEGIRHDSPRFGETFRVQGNLGGRNHILFHCGNSVDDSRGCILLAESFSPNNRIQRSRVAFQEFMELTSETDYFILQITETY